MEQGKKTLRVKDFNLEQTLECGQCFNFEKIGKEEYIVVAFGRMLHVKQEADELSFLNSSEDDIKNIWVPYFDLDRDYAEIKAAVVKAEPRLKAAVDEFGGIRILNQDFRETLISFIISQNKNIPHIKQIVRNISVAHGEKLGEIALADIDINECGPEIKKAIENGDALREYYSFPVGEALFNICEDEFKSLKTGFRAPYLCDANAKLRSGLLEDEYLRQCGFDEAKNRLVMIKGVGDKVANCVLLFSLGYRDAFPVDVWIKRIMQELYFDNEETDKAVIEQKGRELFGEFGGYAQQYMFVLVRNKN